MKHAAHPKHTQIIALSMIRVWKLSVFRSGSSGKQHAVKGDSCGRYGGVVGECIRKLASKELPWQ